MNHKSLLVLLYAIILISSNKDLQYFCIWVRKFAYLQNKRKKGHLSQIKKKRSDSIMRQKFVYHFLHVIWNTD